MAAPIGCNPLGRGGTSSAKRCAMVHASCDCASPKLFEIPGHLSKRFRNPGVVTGVKAYGKRFLESRSSAASSSLQSSLIGMTSAPLVSAWHYPHRPERDSVSPPQYALGFISRINKEKATEPVIAVIDDDNSVRQSLARLLKASGFQSFLYGSAGGLSRRLAAPVVRLFDRGSQLGGMSGMDLEEQLT